MISKRHRWKAYLHLDVGRQRFEQHFFATLRILLENDRKYELHSLLYLIIAQSCY
jgi:hypothetical protein